MNAVLKISFSFYEDKFYPSSEAEFVAHGTLKQRERTRPPLLLYNKEVILISSLVVIVMDQPLLLSGKRELTSKSSFLGFILRSVIGQGVQVGLFFVFVQFFDHFFFFHLSKYLVSEIKLADLLTHKNAG